ncbi:MAG: hypothetical protein KAF91_32695 [Nostoc sp. TH1S01]|nr:hypothetical protein [Nostoc sp. TH1S01]
MIQSNCTFTARAANTSDSWGIGAVKMTGRIISGSTAACSCSALFCLYSAIAHEDF